MLADKTFLLLLAQDKLFKLKTYFFRLGLGLLLRCSFSEFGKRLDHPSDEILSNSNGQALQRYG